MAFFASCVTVLFWKKSLVYTISFLEMKCWRKNKRSTFFWLYFCHLSYPAFSDFLAQSMALSKLCTCIGGKGGRKVFCLLMEPICFKFKCRGEGNQSACWGKPILFTTRIFVFCLGSSLHTIGIKSVSFIVKNKTATVLRGTICGGKAEAQTLQNVREKSCFSSGFCNFPLGNWMFFEHVRAAR